MSRMCLRTACFVLALASVSLAQDVVVEGGQVLVASDVEPLQEGGVVIRKGKVSQLSHEYPEGVRVDRYPNAVLTPGFIDLRTHLGGLGDLDESADAFAEDVDVLSAINLKHKDFAQALRAGITSCVVLPMDGAVFAGRGTLIKTTGTLAPRAPLVAKLSLGQASLRQDRAPTSTVMAFSELRERLTAKHGENTNAFSAFARGDIPGVCTIDDPGNGRRMLRLAEALGLRLIIELTADPEPEFARMPFQGRPVVCGPYSLDTPQLTLKLPGQLDAGGATVCFTSNAPLAHPRTLRSTAIQAARAGLPATKALDGLTASPARALGLEGRVGTLKAGADGDLLVWSGHPLNPSSRLLAVYVDGRLAWSRPATGGAQ